MPLILLNDLFSEHMSLFFITSDHFFTMSVLILEQVSGLPSHDWKGTDEFLEEVQCVVTTAREQEGRTPHGAALPMN